MRRWYGVATGGLGWSPQTFWDATLAEFFLAIEGHNDANRIGPRPMTRAELDAMIEANPPTQSIRRRHGNGR